MGMEISTLDKGHLLHSLSNFGVSIPVNWVQGLASLTFSLAVPDHKYVDKSGRSLI
jgi:ABC-type antimicrobial peptide transport system permease subunit